MGFHCPWRMFGYNGADSSMPFTLASYSQNVTESFFDNDDCLSFTRISPQTMKLLRTLFSHCDKEVLKSQPSNVKDFVALPTTEEDMTLFELICLEDTLNDLGTPLSLASVPVLVSVEPSPLSLEDFSFEPPLSSHLSSHSSQREDSLLTPKEDASQDELSIASTSVPPLKSTPLTPTEAFASSLQTSYDKPLTEVIQDKEKILLESIKSRLCAQKSASAASCVAPIKARQKSHQHKRRGKSSNTHKSSSSTPVKLSTPEPEDLDIRARKELDQLKLQGRIKWERVLSCINQIRRDIPELHAHVTVTGSHSVLHFPHEKSLTIVPKHGKHDTTLPAGVVRSFCFELIKRGLGLQDNT